MTDAVCVVFQVRGVGLLSAGLASVRAAAAAASHRGKGRRYGEVPANRNVAQEIPSVLSLEGSQLLSGRM